MGGRWVVGGCVGTRGGAEVGFSDCVTDLVLDGLQCGEE